MTSLRERLAPIKMILLDVDGVLTDGGVIYTGSDSESKRFDIQDGMGIRMAVMAGLRVGILTGRASPMVERRARELSIDPVKQGYHVKIEGWNEILESEKLAGSEIAYIGDDVQDLPVLWRAGFSGAPANAVDAVKSEVDYVCRRSGGQGAVREFIDLLLREKELEPAVVASITGKKP